MNSKLSRKSRLAFVLSALRSVRGVPGVTPGYMMVRRVLDDIRNIADISRLRASARKAKEGGVTADIIVSVTTFPARINSAWIPIETMFCQDLPPRKIVLVLAEEEFPSRTLPKRIQDQQARGLEVLWVARNGRSLNKLLPTRKAYPDAVIVTIDDDIFYPPNTISELVRASAGCPGAIVGHRGWAVTHEGANLAPYVRWPKAGRSTPSKNILLTGVGGVLYPPDVLPLDILLDVDLAQKLCPRADDIWFWAVAQVAGARLLCLGNHWTRELRQQRTTPALSSENYHEGLNDVQLRQTIQHFGLWNALIPAEPSIVQ